MKEEVKEEKEMKWREKKGRVLIEGGGSKGVQEECAMGGKGDKGADEGGGERGKGNEMDKKYKKELVLIEGGESKGVQEER